MVDYPFVEPMTYRAYKQGDLEEMPWLQSLSPRFREEIRAVAAVLPFRVNNYVLEQLIDWNDIPNDPIFQLTIPQPGMLSDRDLSHMVTLMRKNPSKQELKAEARKIQARLNPHPAGQMELNVPLADGQPVQGIQHKYRETALFFPTQGQTCHAYCTYCFRWAQFVGIDDLKFASREVEQLIGYLREHPEITDVLFTGGDPLIMKTRVLRRYVEPLLKANLENLKSIRFGTKATAYWPYRFLTDPDADDLMRMFEEITDAGIHAAVMSHYSHPRELETVAARAAVQRIRATGAQVRCQAPLIRHVNDNAEAWSSLWTQQVSLGAIPYYMFVERDTGPKNWFSVPLVRALDIFQEAYRTVSGLARTVRGPSMSATPGKVLVDGICEIGGERYFVLKLLQGRNPEWVNQVFFARYDEKAAWLDDLVPAFGDQFFFEEELAAMKSEKIQLARQREETLLREGKLLATPN